MAPTTRSVTKKARLEAPKLSLSHVTKQKSKVSKNNPSSSIEHRGSPPLHRYSSASLFPRFQRSSFSPKPLPCLHSLRTTVHLDPPALSPGSRPSKDDELRLILCEECPGCAARTSHARAHVAENLHVLMEPHDDVTMQFELIDKQLESAQQQLSKLLHEQPLGAESPQGVDEARAIMDRAKRERKACLANLAELEETQRARRRSWGRLCDGMFGNHSAKPKIAPKARITVPIRPDRRYYACQGRWIKGGAWYLQTNLLDLP